MKPRKTTRRRKADVRAEQDAQRVAETAEATAPVKANSTRPPAPSPPPATDAPRARMRTEDLMAIAQMDPEEMARWMDGAAPAARVEAGARVDARVIRVGEHTVFAELSSGVEATVDRDEMPDATVGNRFTAMVIRSDDGGVHLTKHLSGDAAAEFIAEAHATGVPVEGRVTGRNKGGLEVALGGLMAFCPASRVTRERGADLDRFIGQTLQFRVVEDGDRVIVDRRVLQDEAAEAHAESLYADLAEGSVRDGVVRSVQPFGVFIDLGGVDGLLGKRDGGDKLKVGAKVRVVVETIDADRRRIGLSLEGGVPQSAAPKPKIVGDTGGFGTLADLFRQAKD